MESEPNRRPPRVLTVADFLLTAGFLCTALAAGVLPFVMLGLVGFPLLLVALGMFITAGLFARDGGPGGWKQLAGTSLFAIGILSVIVVAAYAATLAFGNEMAARSGASAPSIWQWMMLVLMSVLSSSAVSLGVLLRTGASPLHCVVCGLMALAVWPTAIIVFWIVKLAGQPLTA